MATLIRGTLAGTPTSGTYSGSDRAWMCMQTYFGFCNTHITTTTAQVAGQLQTYRDIAYFISVGVPSQSIFAAGDFNAEPTTGSGLWLIQWAYAAFKESDEPSFKVTQGTSRTLDYIWRANPDAWDADASAFYWAHTDHRWKVGYF